MGTWHAAGENIGTAVMMLATSGAFSFVLSRFIGGWSFTLWGIVLLVVVALVAFNALRGRGRHVELVA